MVAMDIFGFATPAGCQLADSEWQGIRIQESWDHTGVFALYDTGTEFRPDEMLDKTGGCSMIIF